MYAWNLEGIVIVRGSRNIWLDLAPWPYNQGYDVYHGELKVVNVDVGFSGAFLHRLHMKSIFIETKKFHKNLSCKCNDNYHFLDVVV